MAIFAEVYQLADFDGTVGRVSDFPMSGYENDPCVRAQGNIPGLGYGQVDLGEAKSDLYVRGYFCLPSSTSAGRPANFIIRALDNASINTCFTLKPLWGANFKAMQSLRLTIHDNVGSTDFDLEHPMPSHGIFWCEFRVTTGATYGTVTAWIAGQEVLPETRIVPNDNRAARYVRFGVPGLDAEGAPSWDQCYMDQIILADEYSGPPDFSPTLKKQWTEFGQVHNIYTIKNSPVGSWQDILPGISDYIIESLTFHPGCVGLVDFRDKNQNVLWRSPQNWDRFVGLRQDFRGRTHALQHARQLRCNALQLPMHIELHVRIPT